MAPTWNPVSSSVGPEGGGARVGTVRASMLTNPLLAKAELGKVKPILFARPEEEHIFGYSLPKDPENARELTMMWKEHTPSPGLAGAGGQPVPDFKAMNKDAAKSGLTTAKELPAFRAANLKTVKKFDHTRKPGAGLPSDRNPAHTYGKPSAHRTADVVRQAGPVEPPMKHLIQGAYQDEWIRTNVAKEHDSAGRGAYIPPVPTRSTIGHAIGAQRYLQPHHAGEEWKMSKFKKVPAKVPAYMGATAAFGHHQAAEQTSHEQPPLEAHEQHYEPTAAEEEYH